MYNKLRNSKKEGVHIKEYCLYCIYRSGKPFILNTYSDFISAKFHLYDIINTEEERNRIYYVDNNFFNNKYNSNINGKYFCIKERNVSEWKKVNKVEDFQNNILLFKKS